MTKPQPGKIGTLTLRPTAQDKVATATPPHAGHRRKYDYAVFIGRMRPVTKAHLANIRTALDVGQYAVVVVGSAAQARSPRTPFHEGEVEQMLRGNFTAEENARLVIRGMRDMYNSSLWLSGVRSLVAEVAREFPAGQGEPRIGLVGHFKDARTSDYLKRFRGWGLENVPDHGGISATPIRDDYWTDPEQAVVRHAAAIPDNVAAFLRDFARRPEYGWLVEEHKAFVRDEVEYAGLRYRPTFHAADPVVIQDGHVLLIERDLRPGLGLLSLPGAFVREEETIADAAIRSLTDKTKIKVPTRILGSRTTASHVFDYPWRSERGRIISTAYLIELDEEDLPRVGAGKGAARSVWMPLSDIDPRTMYEDHFRIIEVMVGFMRKT